MSTVRHCVIVASLAAALVAAACGDDEAALTPPPSSPPVFTPAPIPQRSPTQLELPIRVAVTLPLFVEFAELAGPENAEVISLIPPGANPHTYEFTAADRELMKGIDFFFLNGLGLDTHLQDAIEANRDESAYVIPFAPNIKSPQGGELTAEQVRDNAHLWLDPGVAYVYTEIVADEFIIYDGIRQDYYMSSFVAYRDRLLALQAELEAELAVIPAERRKLITMHDSFTHFARRFDFTVVAVAGTEPVTALAEAEVERLVQEAQREGVPAVFAEYGYDDSAMAEVARRAGVPLCRLYTEMVPLGDGVESYEEMMRANVRELVRCLGA